MRKSLAIAASAAALLALGLTGCSSAASGTAAAGKDVTCPNGKIKFGILPYEDPSRLEPAYKTLAKALENWSDSRKGRRKGRRMGFPRFRKKGRGRESVGFTTGAIRVDDKSHVVLPKIGRVRTHEPTTALLEKIRRL